MTAYPPIVPSGGDTSTPLNLSKRLGILSREVDLTAKRFLDFGCGSGEYLTALLAAGVDARGVEYSGRKIGDFRTAHPDLADRVLQTDGGTIDHPDSSFDVVMANEVLEHVPDEARTLGEIRRVLAPGGTFVVFSPNRLYPFETHGVSLVGSGRSISPWFPFVPWVPVPIGRRVLTYRARNYWPWDLRRMLESAGFDVIRRGWVWQTFENISGEQPAFVGRIRPVLRKAAGAAEKTPVLRAFGVSQLIVARRG